MCSLISDLHHLLCEDITDKRSFETAITWVLFEFYTVNMYWVYLALELFRKWQNCKQHQIESICNDK